MSAFHIEHNGLSQLGRKQYRSLTFSSDLQRDAQRGFSKSHTDLGTLGWYFQGVPPVKSRRPQAREREREQREREERIERMHFYRTELER